MAGTALHPRLTMDDITEVASTSEIEKRNTISVTKNTEIRSVTLLSIIGGAAAGLVLFLITVGFLGLFVSTIWIVAGAILGPFLVTGTVNDATGQARWRRLIQGMKSKNVTGKIFFPNSSHPEDVTDTEVVVFLT